MTNKGTLFAALESGGYGVDATPDRTNAILYLKDGFSYKPLDGAKVARDFVRPHFGSGGSIRVENFGRLKFQIELSSAGLPSVDSPAPFDMLLRMCGLAAVYTNDIISTAQSGTSNTIKLNASASATDNRYVGMDISLGEGLDTRTIVSYDGTSKIAQVDRPWTSGGVPGAGASYMILKNVGYSPISKDFESGTLYFDDDGVQYIMLGARGSASINWEVKKIPTLSFDVMGLVGQISDVALASAISWDGWIDPVPVSSETITDFVLHGIAGLPFQSLNFDMNNSLIHRLLVGAEDVRITGRQSNGKLVAQATPIASDSILTGDTVFDWYGKAKASTRGNLSMNHGTVHGNKIGFFAPQVILDSPDLQAADGIRMLSVGLDLSYLNGNDEFKLLYK
jgi:hypothetical protein